MANKPGYRCQGRARFLFENVAKLLLQFWYRDTVRRVASVLETEVGKEEKERAPGTEFV